VAAGANAESSSLGTSLREAGFTNLGHLVKMTSTASGVDAFRQNINITSVRMTDRLVEEVCAALPQHLRADAGNHVFV